MKRINQYFTIFLASILLLPLASACKENLSDAELLERDKIELRDHLDGNKVLSYKFCKLVLRSLGAPDQKDDARMMAFKAKAEPIFSRFFKYQNVDPESLGVLDYINLYRDYLALKDFVIETDEDIFPSLIEALTTVYYIENQDIKFELPPEKKLLYQNIEHAALSGLVMLSKDLGRSIALYECAETEPQFLPDGEAKILLQFYRGFLFFQAGLFYLSEKAYTNNIQWLEQNPQLDLTFTKGTLDLDKGKNEKAYLAYHGMNHLMRGIDRLMMEREIDEERALQDFEKFVQDAKEAGLDVEPVWVVEAYLYMKREENEKAIEALQKLKKSILLSLKEKDAIEETIQYLKDREAGKALNSVYDNVFMSKIIIQYMVARLKDVDWEKLMLENDIPHTKEIFGTIHSLEGVVLNIDQYTNTDTIANVGKEIAKDVTEKVTNESKNLWEKAKNWWESE